MERVTDFLTLDEVRSRLRISKPTFYHSVAPTLPIIAIGGRRFVRSADLERWIADQVRAGPRGAAR